MGISHLGLITSQFCKLPFTESQNLSSKLKTYVSDISFFGMGEFDRHCNSGTATEQCNYCVEEGNY